MSFSSQTYARFHRRLFWSVIAVFLLTGLCFLGFQYTREKQYKIGLLNSRLTNYNDYIDRELRQGRTISSTDADDTPRVSVIDFSGTILFDTNVANIGRAGNHAARHEVQQAMNNGQGYDVRRRSKLTGDIYFYSAKKYDHYIIRSALPYDSDLAKELTIDYTYIFVTVAILLVFVVVFYNMTRHLGQNINRLSDFATKAEQDEIDEYPARFPNDEVGDIARKIVRIYNRLQKTQKALVAEQQRVIEQQQEQARIKRELTQNVAHELKTPVSSIQGYLETIINNTDLPPATLRSFLEKSYQQSTRLGALLRDMANLTRIDEASALITREKIDLSALIAGVLADVAPALKEKHIRVVNATQTLSLTCDGNHSLLYSIFRNLVDNTIAYAGTHIDLHVHCNTEEPDFYYFSYSDSGTGIEQEHLGRIFERFYRVDKGRSRKAGGTGLGLAVVKNAVLFHGGTISARQRPGGGLEFLFSIKRS